MAKRSRRYLAEVEVIFRDANQTVSDFIVETEGVNTSTTLPFYCECSAESCRERIALTPGTYNELHRGPRQFVVKVGHNVPDIEMVTKKSSDYYVVEKFGDPPLRQDIERSLKELNK